MKIISLIRPSQPLTYLKWYDILIVTAIMFGQFIYRSTELFLAPKDYIPYQSDTGSAATDGAAYSSNLTLQLILLALALVYLAIRHYDFKQLPLRFRWSLLFWVPLIFAVVGLFGDVVTSLRGEYNYFDPAVLRYIDPLDIFRKLTELSPLAIGYALLNGFYEEIFFLGLLTSVQDQHKWWVLVYSTIIRFSFHTYQGLLWAFIIGVVYGLFYYFLYKYKVKNLLPFFLAHALADMFGSSLIYLLVNWRA